MAVLTIDPRELVARSPAMLNGNTPWASAYIAALRRVIVEHAAEAPRTLQRHLGPSELGHVCDRQVAGKMAAQPSTNHVNDPWASIVGTAIHAWLAEAFTADNARHGLRWIAESRVVPHPDHPGTADLYDAVNRAVVDWKNLGESSMAKVKAANGPPQHYVVQLLLYGQGYRNLGLPVDRVVLAALPRTKSTLDTAYAWERPYTPADDVLLDEVFAKTAVRKLFAKAIVDKQISLMDVPATPTDDGCYFCLSGDTEVVTRQGIRKISELAGASHELLVPQDRVPSWGSFHSVPVRSFGIQPLHKITLQRYRATKVIYATTAHRWVLADNSRTTTAELTVGDRLASIKAQPAERTAPMSMAIAQGFTYGDGAVGTGNRPSTLAIYGRSEKDKVLEHFGPVTARTYNTADDTVQNIYGLPRFWKKLPPLNESRTYLLSWLAGYFAADGTISASGQASISSADRGALVFVRDLAAVCGITYGTIRTKLRDGFGKGPSELHTLDVNARDLPEWFWILPHHNERATQKVTKLERKTYWSVVSVEKTDRLEEVFCATVPGVEAFALSDGLVTGNCPFYRPEVARPGAIDTVGCPGTVGNRP